MARAETLESAGAGGGGGGGGGRGGAEGERGGSCRMELPLRGFGASAWSNQLTTTATSISTSYDLHQSLNLPLHTLPLHTLPLLPQSPPPPRPPQAPSSTREEEEEEEDEQEEERPRAEDRFCSGEPPAQMTGSGREERQEASREQGPLADMQAQVERPCWGSARRGEATVEAEDIRRVAQRLMAIGDQINTTVLSRPHAAPQWRHFRSACLHLLNFISQAFNNLYHFR